MPTCILINWFQDISSFTILEQICIKYNYIIFTGYANTKYETIVTKWHLCETNQMKKTILAHWMGPDSLCVSAYWEIHLIGCPAIQMLHLVGTNSRHIFCWPLDFDRQIFVLPQDSLLVSTICWPSPSRVLVLQKVFSGTIWSPHIIRNYPSTIRNTPITAAREVLKIYIVK